MNSSPNCWRHNDWAYVKDGPWSTPIKVRVAGFERSLVRLEFPNGERRLRPYSVLERLGD